MVRTHLICCALVVSACQPGTDTGVDAPTTPNEAERPFPFGDRNDALGAAIVDLMAWHVTVPESGEESSRLVQAARAAKAALAADPAAAEAKVLAPCRAAPVEDAPLQFACMDMLGAFDTPATVAWLGEVATAPLPRRVPESPTTVTEADVFVPKVFQVHRAITALADRARAGSATAATALVDAAVGGDPGVRVFAVGAALDALPRAATRQELLRRLDPSQHHLVYAHP
jgi:hypothetical protein